MGYRLRLNQEEWESIQNMRAKHTALKQECEQVGIPIDDVNHYWYKGKHYSLHVNNQVNFYDIKDQLITELKSYAPKYPTLHYPELKEGHLLVVDPADIHIGKLCSAFESGEDYNESIAVTRVKEGIQGLINKSEGFGIDHVLLIIGNDALHVDTPKATTTSGTSQDTSLMWYDAFRIALQLYREAIEMLIQVAPVTVQYDPSNHDYQSGFFLAQALEGWFGNCEGVQFRNSIAHRKYFRYGLNLIGTTHGDGAKEQDLALLMAHEAKEYWSECIHRYFYTHHLHHKRSKDYMSVTVETLRSPSGTDSWHHRNGFAHAPKAIEGFVHHKTNGQIARFTHLF